MGKATEIMRLGARYLLGTMVASVPWAIWVIAKGSPAWLCSTGALFCALVVYLFATRGAVSCDKPKRRGILLGWQFIFIVFIIMASMLDIGGKSISRWVLVCSVSVLHELLFRYVFLFEYTIVGIVRPFCIRAFIQSMLWSLLLVTQQCLIGAPTNYIIAMMGGLSLSGPYFCAARAKNRDSVSVSFSHDVSGFYQHPSSLSYGQNLQNLQVLAPWQIKPAQCFRYAITWARAGCSRPGCST